MVILSFETLSFAENNDFVTVTLLNLFITKIPKEDFEKISPFSINNAHSINFENIDDEKASFRFGNLLNKYFEHLTNKLTGNKATYIHRNSGIPLIGNVSFGIVYRNSSIIEIKPVTSCNLDCVYCSISEGLSSKKHDFVIEKDYLVEELENLLKFVNEPVEIHIGVQGEPFLYADMGLLIEDLQKMNLVHTISIDTNGTLLSKEKIDDLAKNNKLQINFSLDAIDTELSKKIAGVNNYNLEHVKKMIAYASNKLSKKEAVIVAPVFMQDYNQAELEKIILWIKEIKNTSLKQPTLGIQNFLRYKTGRNPTKEMGWDDFYLMLEKLEKKHDIKLKLNKDDFNVKPTKELPKPFNVGKIVRVIIKCTDRFSNSVIAVAKGRNISVPNCKFVLDKPIKVKILRDKHNVFVGELVNY